MNEVLSRYLVKFFNVCIDDIVVYSKTTEDHGHHLTCVLEASKEAHLKINVQKSEFFRGKAVFLGRNFDGHSETNKARIRRSDISSPKSVGRAFAQGVSWASRTFTIPVFIQVLSPVCDLFSPTRLLRKASNHAPYARTVEMEPAARSPLIKKKKKSIHRRVFCCCCFFFPSRCDAFDIGARRARLLLERLESICERVITFPINSSAIPSFIPRRAGSGCDNDVATWQYKRRAAAALSGSTSFLVAVPLHLFPRWVVVVGHDRKTQQRDHLMLPVDACRRRRTVLAGRDDFRFPFCSLSDLLPSSSAGIVDRTAPFPRLPPPRHHYRASKSHSRSNIHRPKDSRRALSEIVGRKYWTYKKRLQTSVRMHASNMPEA